MRDLVTALCSDACAGRRAGSKGGALARSHVVDAFRGAGLDPFEAFVPGCKGANVLALQPGSVDRWIVVGAHYDHLGKEGSRIYRGADDNAAAVAILVEAARGLAGDRAGRGVVFASFDGEEPPFFLSGGMGSQHFLREPPVPRERIDLMVCMDLCGHRFGPEGLPDEVGSSLFALGGERSEGTRDHVLSLARAERDLIVRPMDAEIIPPLSDYEPFWREEIPFLFLSAGRSSVYHTPEDTPERLDWDKMKATARWLERFVRESRAREPIRWRSNGRDDRGTLDQLDEVLAALEKVSAEAALARSMVGGLVRACGEDGRLPPGREAEMQRIIGMIEERLA